MLAWALETFPAARDLPGLDAKKICDLAEEGAGWAEEVIEREGYYLGLGLANLVTLFAPEQICLGGGVMRRWSLFEQAARQVVLRHGGLLPAAEVRITPAVLGGAAPLIGAAQVWVHQSAG
jgi:glucokinase